MITKARQIAPDHAEPDTGIGLSGGDTPRPAPWRFRRMSLLIRWLLSNIDKLAQIFREQKIECPVERHTEFLL